MWYVANEKNGQIDGHQRDQGLMDGQRRRFGVEDAGWMMEVHCGKLDGED